MCRHLHIFYFLCLLMCAWTPARSATVHKTGFLQDYHRLEHIGGVPIEQVWINPEFDIRDYRRLYITPVMADPAAYRMKGESDRGNAMRLGAAFRTVLERQLRGAGIFEFVSTDPYFRTVRDGALILELRVTQINAGFGLARVLVGFGAGATEIQLEGRLIEPKSCRILMEFADRRLHPGSSLIAGPVASNDPEYLIGIDMKQMLQGLVKLFVYMREAGPVYKQQ
ncbi:MAG: DUF4410 domain-containing protein [bacterium]|nr:DUF4410 domain-containing protein [Candidatus Sumerlaeota bacterium]